jgi:hypothetical protein
MAMSDKELKKIKEMMPSGVSMAKIKSLLGPKTPKSKAGKTADRNPPKAKKARGNTLMAQQQQAAMQQLYKTKRQKVNKAKLR